MRHFLTRTVLACFVFLTWIDTACPLPADDAKLVSYALFAPGQTEKSTSALTALFTNEGKNASLAIVKTLPDAIASKADILVLAMNESDFNALGPYDAAALKKCKIIGIGFGAAKLFGGAGLKISAGNCAHGFEPRILVQENATTPKEGFDEVFGVYSPYSQTYPAGDVDYMPFGIYLGDKHPEIRPGLDVIARYSGDAKYTPVVREGNAVLVGFNPHAEDWSPPFRALMAIVATELNATSSNLVPLQAPNTAPNSIVGEWANAASGLKLKITLDAKGSSIEAWAAGSDGTTGIPWGKTHLDRLGDNVAATNLPYGFATWDHGFKSTHLTARLAEDQLVVETFSVFKDGSGRSNYRTVEKLSKVTHPDKDKSPSLKRVPNFFSWNYTFEPEPGKRIWIRVDDATFIERYPSGYENRFRILRPETVDGIDGIVLQISDSSMQAFVPYKPADGANIKNLEPSQRDVPKSGPEDSHVAKPAELPHLLMRAEDTSPWQFMGEMNHIE
jgi:hypothetical protein